MENVTIGNGVKEIGLSAFEGTKWLEDNRNSEASALIVNNILVDGKNMSGDIVISPDITSINSDAFDINQKIALDNIRENMNDIDAAYSLNLLSKLLEKYHGKKERKRYIISWLI